MPKISTLKMEQDVKQMLDNALNINHLDYNEGQMVKGVIEKNNGKKVTKHLLKHFPEGTKLDNQLNHLIYFKLPNTDGRWGKYLIAREDHILDYTKFEDMNAWCCRGALERIQQLEQWLEPDKFIILIDNYSKLKQQYEDLVKTVNFIQSTKLAGFFNPAYTEILKYCGISRELITQLSKH